MTIGFAPNVFITSTFHFRSTEPLPPVVPPEAYMATPARQMRNCFQSLIDRLIAYICTQEITGNKHSIRYSQAVSLETHPPGMSALHFWPRSQVTVM